jgi:RimJ/RimL family protein N-acetyltransferase
MELDTLVQQPVFETERFVLRPVQRSDAGLIEFNTRDIRVARQTISIPHPLPPGATQSFIDRCLTPNREEDVWVIDGSQHGWSEVIGLVSLERLGHNKSELGYWVAPTFWNQGVASEVAKAIVAQNPMRNATIVAAVFQDNPASARVLTNCGFEYLGDAEAFSVARKAKVATWTYLRKMH